MEVIEQLNNWFNNGKDYSVGVSIYQEFGLSMGLKRIFTKGPNTYNHSKLESELNKLLSKYQSKPAAVKTKAKVIKTKIVQTEKSKSSEIKDNRPENKNDHSVKRYSELQVPGYDFNELPDQLKYEWTIRIKLYKEANAHHYRLDSLTDPIEIQKSVDIILQNFEKIDDYWERLDYWGKNGFVPPVIDAADQPEQKEYSDPFEMLKRRSNLRTYITKAKRRLGTLKDNKKIADKHRKIGLWELELNDLEQKIKG